MRPLVLFALLLAAPTAAADSSPWLDWVASHSPHGFDITPDGTIWINLGAEGAIDDFSFRAGDLQAAQILNDRRPIFWVRGNHIRNSKVNYRTSKARYQIDCDADRITTLMFITYDKDGMVLSQTESAYTNTIVPESYGAKYARLFC